MIPDVDISGSTRKNAQKLKFAEAVDRYVRLPYVNETVLFEIVRHKLGKYGTDSWFDPCYANLPKSKRPESFLEAFKKEWMRMMDCDDYNKLIQGFHFDNLFDAVQVGIQFEQQCLPYLELADNAETRKAAERMKVARFRKILGGTLMAQMLNVHPQPFESVREMISVIKELNDRLGVMHRAQPSEQPFHVMALAANLGENEVTMSNGEAHTMAVLVSPASGSNCSERGYPKKALGIEKGWIGWNKPQDQSGSNNGQGNNGSNQNNSEQ